MGAPIEVAITSMASLSIWPSTRTPSITTQAPTTSTNSSKVGVSSKLATQIGSSRWRTTSNIRRFSKTLVAMRLHSSAVQRLDSNRFILSSRKLRQLSWRWKMKVSNCVKICRCSKTLCLRAWPTRSMNYSPRSPLTSWITWRSMRNCAKLTTWVQQRHKISTNVSLTISNSVTGLSGVSQNTISSCTIEPWKIKRQKRQAKGVNSSKLRSRKDQKTIMKLMRKKRRPYASSLWRVCLWASPWSRKMNLKRKRRLYNNSLQEKASQKTAWTTWCPTLQPAGDRVLSGARVP